MGATDEGPIIHIGFPKCASTFLQNTVFAHSAGLYTRREWQALCFDHFVLKDEGDFDTNSARESFRGPLTGPHLTPVISNENLVGGAAARYDWMVPTADRLVRAFPTARVLMVVREQRSMGLSLYQQLIKRGESVKLREAISPTGAPGYYPRLRLERLRYDLAVQTYVDRFGPDRVRVLAYEELVADPGVFIQKVLEFAGSAEVKQNFSQDRQNVGFKGFTVDARRRINKVAAENYTGPGGPSMSFRLAGKFSSITDHAVPDSLHEKRRVAHQSVMADVVGSQFAESNHRLAEMTGLDLASLGYSL